VAPEDLPPLRKDRAVLGWMIAQGVSEVGDEIWLVALAYTAAQFGDPGLASVVIACAAIPRALLMLIGGALTDRLDARRVMLTSDVTRILVLCGTLLVLAAFGTSAAALIGTGLLLGIADAFYVPASGAFPRQLRARADMTQLFGIRHTVTRTASLGGPSLGGLIVAGVGLTGAVAVDAASFVVVALVLMVVRPRWPRAKAAGGSILADVKGGISYLRVTPRVRDLVIAVSGLNVFVTPVVAIGLALRTVAEGWGPVVLGVLTASLGGGALLGTLASIRLRPRHPVFVALLLLLAQAVLLALVGFASLVAVLVAMFLVGVSAGLASPMLAGVIQATVDDEYLGRTGAILSLADEGLAPLALTGFGALAAVVGLVAACIVFCVCFLLLVGFALSRPQIRALRADGSVDR
jgi:MFS family permease